MNLINPKYKQLKPTLEYLSDPVVLAQAWKKSHSYIRSHNWYADTLELDASTFNLEENINSWSEELRSQTYRPTPMRLVPAPKGDIWTFHNTKDGWNWKPKKSRGSEPLRPLAHLTIKDQVIATAIMICIADAVETAQGATTDKENVSNYGNRLFCKWDARKENAKFRWGNSTTYSKYYQDYQRFLDRSAKSAHFIEELNQAFESNNETYEVQLDMSSFYDSINRDLLLNQLRNLVDGFYLLPKDETETFWNVVQKSFNWQWHENDFALNDCLKVNLKNDGLPQGLVASGFFANVYLIAFDKVCRSLKASQELDFSIQDYCRYVDDLRFIISVDRNKELSVDIINKQLVEMLQSLLPQGIKLNQDKTKIIKWNGEEGETVRQMEGIQSLASGPIDMDSLEFAESSLDNLFTRAESSHFSEDTNQHPLANVHTIKLEVREDTLLRFAANRWAKLFKSRRKLTNQSDLTILDAAQESVAKRFVAAWSRNPALTLLLKKGLQLFPDKSLLETVWGALLDKVDDKTPVREKYIAYYCLAEILRFSATDLKKVLPQDLPHSLNINDYFDWLEKAAIKLLENKALPWFLKQQAGLVLVGREPSVRIEEELLLNNSLKIASGEIVIGTESEVLPATIVAWQMTKSEKVITSFTNWLVSLEGQSQYYALLSIAVNDPDLFSILFMRQSQEIIQSVNQVSTALGLNVAPMTPDLTKWPKKIMLASIINSPGNPFIHENALIKLAIASIKEFEQTPDLSLIPLKLIIECDDWVNIQNPDRATIKVFASEVNAYADIDPRYQPPSWLNQNKDSQKLYELGCLLRASAVGSCDFTSQKTLFRQDINTYYGIKSSWYKRTISMMHSPEALVGEAAPMSGWVTELLFNLLQWPGLDLDGWEYLWPDEISLISVLKVLQDRNHHQNQIFGVASNTPVYIERVKTGPDFNGCLRVVNVQTLIPKLNSFENDLELNNPDFRKIHRNHLADICNIILKKLKATDASFQIGLQVGGQQVNPEANLIIFPELSVHQDDIDLLEALSATTKAIIFAGIVFHKHKGDLINRALWLIPFITPEKGIRWIKRWQGKHNMTQNEKGHIVPWRPYQLIIELKDTLPGIDRGYRLSGSICYDATDMKLTADLRDISDAYLISALNKDINTFDSMIDALHYHMYQHVVLANTGEFGGSAAKSPFKLPHHRTIAQIHGNNQISVVIFEIEMMSLLEDKETIKPEEYPKRRKMRPAGITRSGLN